MDITAVFNQPIPNEFGLVLVFLVSGLGMACVHALDTKLDAWVEKDKASRRKGLNTIS